MPATLLLLGVIWALPGVFTNLLAGYMTFGDGLRSFNWRAYPPIGGWQWLKYLRAPDGSLMNTHVVDIVWLRYSRATGNASLVLMAALCLAAGIFVYGAVRVHRLQTRLQAALNAPQSEHGQRDGSQQQV